MLSCSYFAGQGVELDVVLTADCNNLERSNRLRCYASMGQLSKQGMCWKSYDWSSTAR